MSLKAMKVICIVEEAARQARVLAHKQAQESIDEADRNGKESVASTLARAKSEIAHLIHTLDQRATEEAIKLASTTANRQATKRARAERRLDDAASLIVERIVKV